MRWQRWQGAYREEWGQGGLTWSVSNICSSGSEQRSASYVWLLWSLGNGSAMGGHRGPPIAPWCPDSWSRWTNVQGSDRSGLLRLGAAYWRIASCGGRGRRQRKPVGRSSWQGGWIQGLRGPYTPCICCGSSIHRRRSGGFSSLKRGMRSMRRTGQPCYGLSCMSGPVACSLHLTDTVTGARWW